MDNHYDQENDMTSPKHPRGFIFMCNSVTKPTCFRYRVFGFPIGKKNLVEKIKPGTKLFLFDIELKLLYGIYEAISYGQVNLEPDAFGGKFPAQVKFKIFGGYLPVPEKTFRMAIIDNYKGKKFSSELNEVQVKKLQLLFRPLSSSSSPPASLTHGIAYKHEPRHLPYARQFYAPQVIRPPQHLHGNQMVQQHHLPHAVAQNGSFLAPPEHYYHVNSQPSEDPFVRYQQSGAAAPIGHGHSYYTQQYSSGGPIRRHDAVVQGTAAYYQTIRAESEYRIALQQNGFQHQSHSPSFEGQSATLPYDYDPSLQQHGPETVAAYYHVPPSMPSTTVAVHSHSVSTDPYAISSSSHSVSMDPYAVASSSYSVSADPYASTAPSHSVSTDPYAIASSSYPVSADPYASAAPSHSVSTDPYAIAAPSHSVHTDPYAVTAYYNTAPVAETYVPSAVFGSYQTASNPYVMSNEANAQHSVGTGTSTTYVI